MRSPLLAYLLFACFAFPVSADPIFPNSVVSNDLEFIKTEDPSAFACLKFDRRDRAEMPDKRSDELFVRNVNIFSASYTDNTSVELWAHPDLGSQSDAEALATYVAEAIGKLPTVMRSRLDHVVIHEGDETAFGEADGHFFVLYSENIRTRISNHDLEETVFHESVHATLDSTHLRKRAWRRAQDADNAFITDYAADLPDKEDMAESALFAWAMLVHPGRLPANVEAQARAIMPNRLAYFEDLFLSGPIFKNGRARGC